MLQPSLPSDLLPDTTTHTGPNQASWLQPASSSETLAAWRKGEGTLLSLLYAFFLSSAAGALEVAPGEEFRVALIEAKQVAILRCETHAIVSWPSGRLWLRPSRQQPWGPVQVWGAADWEPALLVSDRGQAGSSAHGWHD